MARPLDPEGRAAVDAVAATAERSIPARGRNSRARTARLDEALAAVQRLLRWVNRRPERLAAAFEALDPLPGGAPEWLAELELALVIEGRVDEAASIAYPVAEIFDTDLMLGDFVVTVAQYGPRERAVVEIERCLARFPRGAFTALSCGDAWIELGEPARAEPLLRRALELTCRGPSGAAREPSELLEESEEIVRDALSLLLPLLLRQGREDEARAVYRRHAAPPVLRRPANVVPIASARAGRNDPCPCGSGRKFKHCCGSVTASAATAPDASALLEAIIPFGVLTETWEDSDEVLRLYMGAQFTRQHDDNEIATFVEWRMIDLRDETGRTALQRFADWHAEQLDPPARALLDELDRSQLRLYEVRGIRPGEGLTLFDLLDGRSVEVREKLGSRAAQPWDLLAARLFACGGVMQMAGGVLHFPAAEKPELLAAWRSELARLEADRPELAEADRLALAAGVFQRQRTAMRDRPLPQIANEDGDPMVFSVARYDVRDADEVRRRLSGARGFVAVGRAFDWIATRPAGLILGRIALSPRRMKLETNSRERLTRGRALLEKLLGDLAWHRGDSFSSLEEQFGRRRSSRQREPAGRTAAAAEIPPELQLELRSRFLEQHYRSWIDESIPMLDGRTPRQAAADPVLRPRLVDLLRMIENSEARAFPLGQRYDFGWLWEQLNVGREE
ncbi:MAG: SEC-C domain-containing protein [Acidobacteria bacterium]|jgi:hypothetical protein|nr:SEC-C domain-containing protein [Acidobacteriota bacterium]